MLSRALLSLRERLRDVFAGCLLRQDITHGNQQLTASRELVQKDLAATEEEAKYLRQAIHDNTYAAFLN
jgi:hypothetical protein